MKTQYSPELEEEFDDIILYARQKFREGAEKHGIFNPDNDPDVDRLYEAENELIDNINYSLMAITKLRRLRKKIRETENELFELETKLEKSLLKPKNIIHIIRKIII